MTAAGASGMRLRYLIAAAVAGFLYAVVLTGIGLGSAASAEAANEDVDVWPLGAVVGAVFFGVVLTVLVYVVVVGDQIGRVRDRHDVRFVAVAQAGVLVVVDLALVMWLGAVPGVPWTTPLILLGGLLLATVPGWLVVGVLPWFVRGPSTSGSGPDDTVDAESDDTDEGVAARREIAIQDALDRVRAREGR
ncbi:hypothetical protein [Promicromonospora panici]|uniref:hypothetical protein n=1 Tax=Promicromonospora panici TaxID=2219658 RepID=UPI00101D7953|nr:hypothetical protein [Promicromonospora panici]